jgi:nucleoside-diphosphate kinase
MIGCAALPLGERPNHHQELCVAVERTFSMLKPGILPRRLVGEILSRIERKGLNIIGMKLMRIDRALAETHYAEHAGKAFYDKLIDYTISAPVVLFVLEGESAVTKLRRLCGPTDINESIPGTIRGDFAFNTRLNIVHASDSAANAAREIALFFKDDELIQWKDGNHEWF